MRTIATANGSPRNMFESIGDMYKDRGDKQRAVTYYRRSLEVAFPARFPLSSD